jgi:hypothetical protein
VHPMPPDVAGDGITEAASVAGAKLTPKADAIRACSHGATSALPKTPLSP